MANTLSEFYASLSKPLPTVQQRQGDALKAGIQNYSGTAQQNTQLLNFLQGTQNGTNQQPINASNLGTNSQLNIPGQTPLTDPNAIVQGITTPLPNLPGFTNIDASKSGAYGQATQQLNQLGSGQLAAQRRALELSGQLENKGVREGELQQQFQLQEKQKAQDAAALAIQASQKAYLAEQIAVAGRPIGLERQGGKLDQLRRREAIDLLSKSIVLDAATGDVASALRSVDNALKLEFEPIEAKIATTKMFLEFNQDNFNRAEKQQAQALNIKVDKEKADLDYFRDIKKMYLSEAIKNGGDTSGIMGASSLSALAKLQGTTTTNLLQAETAKDKINTLDNLLNNGIGKAYAVGASFLGRGVRSPVAPGKRKDFISSTETLLQGLTLEQLQNAKKNGATFGALSEGELSLLASTASRISQTAIKDKDGKVIGYNMTEKSFNDELNRIKKYALIDYQNKTGLTYVSPDQQKQNTQAKTSLQQAITAGYTPTEVVAYLRQTPAYADKINAAIAAGYSPEDIVLYLNNQ